MNIHINLTVKTQELSYEPKVSCQSHFFNFNAQSNILALNGHFLISSIKWFFEAIFQKQN
jgi:hypothetical protein